MFDLEKWKTVKKEQKLTIAQIAERAGLPKGTVQNIFCGYIPNPRIDTVQAIERALGIGENTQTENYQNGNLAVNEQFVTEYGSLFNDIYFNRYTRVYSLLNQEQRIYLVGVVYGAVEQFGISYRDIG